MFTIEFDHYDWLSQFYSEWRQTSKLVNLKISVKARVSDFGQKFENNKNFLILFHSSRKHLKILSTFQFDHYDWLSQFYSTDSYSFTVLTFTVLQ